MKVINAPAPVILHVCQCGDDYAIDEYDCGRCGSRSWPLAYTPADPVGCECNDCERAELRKLAEGPPMHHPV